MTVEEAYLLMFDLRAAMRATEIAEHAMSDACAYREVVTNFAKRIDGTGDSAIATLIFNGDFEGAWAHLFKVIYGAEPPPNFIK